jgi:hypothetical protein
MRSAHALYDWLRRFPLCRAVCRDFSLILCPIALTTFFEIGVYIQVQTEMLPFSSDIVFAILLSINGTVTMTDSMLS